MNDIIQAMINRRSIRKYKPVIIPQHTISEYQKGIIIGDDIHIYT